LCAPYASPPPSYGFPTPGQDPNIWLFMAICIFFISVGPYSILHSLGYVRPLWRGIFATAVAFALASLTGWGAVETVLDDTHSAIDGWFGRQLEYQIVHHCTLPGLEAMYTHAYQSGAPFETLDQILALTTIVAFLVVFTFCWDIRDLRRRVSEPHAQ
jgi:hypothetical protein